MISFLGTYLAQVRGKSVAKITISLFIKTKLHWFDLISFWAEVVSLDQLKLKP